MSTGRLLFVGDVTWDTTALVDHVPAADEKVWAGAFAEGVGGVATNAAVAASLAGASVVLVCALPPNQAGAAARSELAALGVHLVTSTSTDSLSRVVVLIDQSGEKRLILWPSSTMYPDQDAVAGVDLTGVAWAHTAVYDVDAAAVLSQRCARAGIPWSLDLEPSTMPTGIRPLARILNGAHTVFINERASAVLGADPVRSLLNAGAQEVVLTRGPGGAVWSDGTTRLHAPAPALASPVLDTTGAGDALAGWFVTARAAGAPAGTALARAVLAASVSCASLGASSSYPREHDLPAELLTTSLPLTDKAP